MIRLRIALAICLFSISSLARAQTTMTDSADRMAWFEQARFGLFMHWGIYSVPAGSWNGNDDYGEWFQLETKMPAAQYALFAKQFTASHFDPKVWAHIAKTAGMKYVVITAKHHDGFCMFDTKLTDYNIVSATPFARDPMKDLADAVRAEGLKFCFYYSLPDWHHPDFPAKYSQQGFHGDPQPDADLEKYVTYMKGQLRELLTNYGPISIIWFDGGGSFDRDNALRVKLIHAQELIDHIHQLQPDCLVNNRLGLPGDYGTPEQHIPGTMQNAPFEVCMTLNDHWGFNKADHNWKSATTVIHNLADIAGKGGNYLLNVGPTSEGEFPPEAVNILGEVGKWTSINGPSIYGTTPCTNMDSVKWGRATAKDNMIYLHVFDWPRDGQLTVPFHNVQAAGAYLLADSAKTPLPLVISGSTITLTLPSTAPDPADSVVVVQKQ